MMHKQLADGLTIDFINDMLKISYYSLIYSVRERCSDKYQTANKK